LLGLVLGGVLLFGTQWSGAKLSWLPFNLAGRIPRLVNPFWKPEGFAGFNANLAGGTVALLLPVPLGYVLFGSRRWVRIGAMLETVALSTLLLLTFSRGAMLAFGAALLVMLVAYDRRWLALVGAVLVVGAVLLVTGQLDSILDPVRNGSITDSVQGLDSRLELWSRGIYMMQDFAFTGLGMGMVEKVLPLLYPTFLIPPSTDVEHVHNLYLEFGAELGFPGLIIVLAQLLLLFFLGWRSVQQSRGTTWGALASGLLGTVVVLAVHGLVDTIPFSPKAYLIIWALFGVTVALALHLRDDGTSTGNTPLPEPGGDSESLHHP
jgi:putative inorganic carbon (HCO3(-)) transporter